ncbi:hypothetical protein HDU97_002640 [Phlyctochytrium planicorne]|nr:hypothetical protein HDU97_002640 [Phlyctochytrium planicorne]
MNKDLSSTTMTTSNRSIVLVTGATGRIGLEVVMDCVLRKLPVRVLLRRDSTQAARLRQMGVEVVFGDLLSTAAMRSAMENVKAAFFLPPYIPLMIQAAVVFATAAEYAKVPHIVALSQWLASPNHSAIHTQQLWLMERVFERLQPAITLTIIHPGFFADNWLNHGLLTSAIQMGTLPILMGTKGLNSVPSNGDIARCCAAVLASPEKYAGQSFRPTGPANLSVAEMVEIISKVIGRKLTVMHMGPTMFNKATRSGGVTAFSQLNLIKYIPDNEANSFGINGPTNHVKYLTGRDPEDFETIVKQYAARPENQRTFINFLLAFWSFWRILMTPARNLTTWARIAEVYEPVDIEEAQKSKDWKETRLTVPVNL